MANPKTKETFIMNLPLRQKPAELLQATGIALEYFPAFEHKGIDDIDMHGHTYVEMNYIIKGRCRQITRDRVHEDGAGAMAIVHYHQEHMFQTPYGPVEKMNVYLDFHKFNLPTLPPGLQEVLSAILPMHPAMVHRFNPVVHLRFHRPRQIAHILQNMYEEQDHCGPGYQEAFASYFRLFLIECCRAAMQEGIAPPAHPDEPGYDPMEKIRQHIDRNFTRAMTLEQLSSLAGGMNPNYLCRRFKEYTGKTVVEYIHHRRIEMALVLLRGGREKILQICLQCGFNDISYFNRKFKDVVGMSPKAYRDRV